MIFQPPVKTTNSYGTILERGRDGTEFDEKIKDYLRRYHLAKSEITKRKYRFKLKLLGVKVYSQKEIKRLESEVKNGI